MSTEEKSVQHHVTRVAALARGKGKAGVNVDALREARQDLQEARLRRDIRREATQTTGANIPMDKERRARLAQMLYPEGFGR